MSLPLIGYILKQNETIICVQCQRVLVEGDTAVFELDPMLEYGIMAYCAIHREKY